MFEIILTTGLYIIGFSFLLWVFKKRHIIRFLSNQERRDLILSEAERAAEQQERWKKRDIETKQQEQKHQENIANGRIHYAWELEFETFKWNKTWTIAQEDGFEIIKWLILNIEGKWNIVFDEEANQRYIDFEEESDAMAFKLRWF